MIGSRFLICAALLLSLIGGSPARAEDATPTRVGRVSLAEGGAAVRTSAKDWSDTGPNHPIAAGMSVRTAPQGRAVLRIGAETIALAGGTELDIAQLDESGMQIVLRRGRIGMRLASLDSARSIEIRIPPLGIRLLTTGDYDIAAGTDREPARLAVIDGRAGIAGNEIEKTVTAGSAVALRGQDPVEATPQEVVADDFVAWWRPEKRAAGEPASLQYVSAEMTGYDALDAHGGWETVDGYGAVWFRCDLPDGWAPYRQGHWRWVAPWGWTWVDDQPWGFAPSHYGRWASLDGRWGWIPGKRVAHPAYMPAAVAFLGTAGVGLSYPDAFSPAVAWFPLAPGEVYWPSYTNELSAIRRLNADAVADVSAIGPGVDADPPADVVTGEYRNRRFASVVPRAVFVGAKPVAQALVELPERRLTNAPLLAGSPHILPPAPRPAVVAAAVGGHRVAPKMARAMRTLARILKPREMPAAARAPAHARLASAPAAAHARAAAVRSGRHRAVRRPALRSANLRQVDARRR
jgi:hypothetical protein